MSQLICNSEDGGFKLICEDDVLNDKRGFAKGPERALMVALLFDGIQVYLNNANSQIKTLRARWREAAYWVHSKDAEYIFAFDNVCESLGIDPNFLRCGLINAVKSQNYEWKRTRRVA